MHECGSPRLDQRRGEHCRGYLDARHPHVAAVGPPAPLEEEDGCGHDVRARCFVRDPHDSCQNPAANTVLPAFSVTAVSILRLRFLVEFKATDNPTYDEYEVIYWSIVERDVSLVCACLPNVRLLLSRLLPKKTYAGDLRESDENAHASLRKNSFAAAGADPGDKIMYSRSFQVEYLENKEGDYSSTMELREWSPTSSRS